MINRTAVALALSSLVLSGCGPHLKKLGVCTGGSYRYANPKGISLPALPVPSPDDLTGAPASDQPGNGVGTTPAPPSSEGGAPVAAPPKRGAMLMARPGQSFGSC